MYAGDTWITLRRDTPRVAIAVACAALLLIVSAAECRAETFGGPAAGDGGSTVGTVLFITDIHFNPFREKGPIKELMRAQYGEWKSIFEKRDSTDLGEYGSTCGYPLFASMLDSAGRMVKRPDFIVFSGDILAHSFKERFAEYAGTDDEAMTREFIKKTVSFVVTQIAATWPGTPVYFSLGNNDSFAGDYALEDEGPFLAGTANLFFQSFIRREQDRAGFMDTYARHGYYVADPPYLKNGRIIGLSSVYFSTHHTDPPGMHSGWTELNWLEDKLREAAAENKNVWLITHIPPGVDAYSTAHSKTTPKTVSLFMRSDFNDRLLSILREHAGTIDVVLAGHTHMDDWRLVFPDGASSGALEAVHIGPAVSPIFAQNPAFQILNYDRTTGELLDMKTKYVNLPYPMPNGVWEEEYVFSTAYGDAPDTAGAERLWNGVNAGTSDRAGYIRHYSTSRTPSLIEKDWRIYWCAAGYSTEAEFRAACSGYLQ